MSLDKRTVDTGSQVEPGPQSPARSGLWRWLSTGLIVAGLVLLGAGGLLAYLNSAAVAEPPPAVGVVEPPVESLAEPPVESLAEPPVESLAEDPLSVAAEASPLGSPAQPTVAIQDEPSAPPSLEQNPLPVVAEASIAGEASTSLPEPAAASLALQPAPAEGQVDEDALQQAEGEVPSGPQQNPPSDPGVDYTPAAANPPTRIVIPAVDLDAEVIPVGWKQTFQDGKLVSVWEVAEYAAGWHKNSALPGAVGNVVLSGHHNTKGEVFRHIVGLVPGDTITLYADDRPYTYTVESRFVLRDKGMSEEKRQENARWIGSFPDERLTLVTCWPYSGNTHRVIVVAKPTE